MIGDLKVRQFDGSRLEERAGAGWVIKDHGQVSSGNRHLGLQATVFQAEISAIIDATGELLKKNAYGKIDFFVDSQAAIQALKGRTCLLYTSPSPRD